MNANASGIHVYVSPKNSRVTDKRTQSLLSDFFFARRGERGAGTSPNKSLGVTAYPENHPLDSKIPRPATLNDIGDIWHYALDTVSRLPRGTRLTCYDLFSGVILPDTYSKRGLGGVMKGLQKAGKLRPVKSVKSHRVGRGNPGLTTVWEVV